MTTERNRIIDLDDGDTPPAETYTVYCFCHNCDFAEEADIPKGVLINQASCPKCGCTGQLELVLDDEEEEVETQEEDTTMRRILDAMEREQTTRPAAIPTPVLPSAPIAPDNDDMQERLQRWYHEHTTSGTPNPLPPGEFTCAVDPVATELITLRAPQAAVDAFSGGHTNELSGAIIGKTIDMGMIVGTEMQPDGSMLVTVNTEHQ